MSTSMGRTRREGVSFTVELFSKPYFVIITINLQLGRIYLYTAVANARLTNYYHRMGLLCRDLTESMYVGVRLLFHISYVHCRQKFCCASYTEVSLCCLLSLGHCFTGTIFNVIQLWS